jgi:hypothetical protein
LISTEMLERFDLPMTRDGGDMLLYGVKPIRWFDEY